MASVSCIYGLVDPEEYHNHVLSIRQGQEIDRDDLMRQLIDMQYERNDIDFRRGTFRVREILLRFSYLPEKGSCSSGILWR